MLVGTPTRGSRGGSRIKVARDNKHVRAARLGLVPLVASCLFSQPGLAQEASLPSFTEDSVPTVDAGHVAFGWTADGPVTITLARPDGESRPVFGGQGERLFLSGLADGDYTLSIAPEGGAVSDTLELEVRHQSLARALWLTLVGAIVFLLVLAVIIRGPRHG